MAGRSALIIRILPIIARLWSSAVSYYDQFMDLSICGAVVGEGVVSQLNHVLHC